MMQVTPNLQWRDRVGFSPTSLLSLTRKAQEAWELDIHPTPKNEPFFPLKDTHFLTLFNYFHYYAL
jgi:hypothetical protein